jgi:BON domain
MRIRTLVVGGLAGAALAFVFDPVAGRGRRSRLRDRVSSFTGGRTGPTLNGRDVAAGTMGTAAGRAGTLGETPAASDDDRPDDLTLADRIHSTVFGEPDVPADRLTIDVANGVVTLRGELDSQEEIDDIAGRIAAVADVLEVDVLVHLPGEPAPNKEAAIEASRDAEASSRDQRPRS